MSHYTQEDFMRDIEADFRNARDNKAQKKKIRELMERYGNSREEIEAKSSMGEWFEFVLANGDALWEEVRREKLAEEAQNKAYDQMKARIEAAKKTRDEDEVVEEEEVEEDSAAALKNSLTPHTPVQKENSFINELKKTAEDDRFGITQALHVQMGEKSMSKNDNYQLGTLSAKYEARGNPAIIGNDNAGGYSYGKYQIATKTGTMQKYINFLAQNSEYKPFAMELNNAGGECAANKKTRAFEETWIKLSKNPKFNKSQFQFIIDTHLNPVLKKIDEKDILNIDNRHPVVKDVLYSMSVQHYRAPKIINKALSVLKNKRGQGMENIDDATLIKELYRQRLLYVKSLPESQYKGDGKITKEEKETIMKKRYPEEMRDALEYLK